MDPEREITIEKETGVWPKELDFTTGFWQKGKKKKKGMHRYVLVLE